MPAIRLCNHLEIVARLSKPRALARGFCSVATLVPSPRAVHVSKRVGYAVHTTWERWRVIAIPKLRLRLPPTLAEKPEGR